MTASEEIWYALRTFYAQEQKVSRHLDRYALTCFIPMCTVLKTVNGGGGVKKSKSKVPFVHNLIFIKKPESTDLLKKALDECPFSTQMYCVTGTQTWVEIASSEILELRIICDQSFSEPHFITQQESELKVGHMVQVVHGPLAGIHGKLVRKNKKYYIVKSMTGLGVMVTVSRWCCVAVD